MPPLEPSIGGGGALPENEHIGAASGAGQPQFRYAAVLVLMLAAVVFLIAAPDANWSLAAGIAIEAAALILTVATSRERESVRLRRALALGLVMIVGVILIALGVGPRWLSPAAAIFVTAGIPFALARGLLRLLRLEGVRFNAVAGSLAIYLSTGLIFAWVVGFIAAVTSTPYFAAQAAHTSPGDKVYFSFTVLTTTGFGDYTPATPAGHALAVIEMLTGQLYLVTVIGLLIGNFAARRRQP
ncbi:MAG: potassium channel family protein [Solirubrobacteraceae bacterium]